ncbi:hypothetical protein AB0D35_07595 [Streptomyces sp. NPDC048301]|uniref:hypothetical protein n=1 Tax=Streptomyces sp. NPDC048301 TaxID=3155631 RepID=UPI003431AF3E
MPKTQAATTVDEGFVAVGKFGPDLFSVLPCQGQLCPAAASSLRLGVLHRFGEARIYVYQAVVHGQVKYSPKVVEDQAQCGTFEQPATVVQPAQQR